MFKKEDDIYWEDSLNYIFHLTEINEVGTHNLLEENSFFDMIFGNKIEFTARELYTIFRILGNLFYNNDLIEKVNN